MATNFGKVLSSDDIKIYCKDVINGDIVYFPTGYFVTQVVIKQTTPNVPATDSISFFPTGALNTITNFSLPANIGNIIRTRASFQDPVKDGIFLAPTAVTIACGVGTTAKYDVTYYLSKLSS